MEIKNAAISLFSELAMRLGLERVREFSGFASLSNADKTKLLSAPPAGAVLPWDDTVDVLLGRVAREGASVPTAIATPVATAYGLAAPGWRYGSSPSTTRWPTSPPPRSTRRGPGGIQASRCGWARRSRTPTWSASPGCSSASRSSPS